MKLLKFYFSQDRCHHSSADSSCMIGAGTLIKGISCKINILQMVSLSPSPTILRLIFRMASLSPSLVTFRHLLQMASLSLPPVTFCHLLQMESISTFPILPTHSSTISDECKFLGTLVFNHLPPSDYERQASLSISSGLRRLNRGSCCTPKFALPFSLKTISL